MDKHIPEFPSTQAEYDAAREGLLDAAIVNVKKSSGTAVSDHENLRDCVQLDGTFIRRQVQICRPHFMVCGNTWGLVADLWPAKRRHCDLVWEVADSCLAVDFVHPGLRILQRMSYYALSAIVAKAIAEDWNAEHENVERGQR